MRHTALLLSAHSATFQETLKACFAILAAVKNVSQPAPWQKNQDGLAGRTEHGADVMIMDIDLPGASGLEAVRALAERHLAAQFLLYNMRDDDLRLFDALKAVANVDRVKSAKPTELLTGPRDPLQGGSPMSAPIARRMVAHRRPAQAENDLGAARLTEREQQVLQMLAEGLLYKEISAQLNISEASVKQHVHRMYGKLHVQNRTEAVNKYFGR